MPTTPTTKCTHAWVHTHTHWWWNHSHTLHFCGPGNNLRALGPLIPHHHKLTPWERNHGISKGGKKLKERIERSSRDKGKCLWTSSKWLRALREILLLSLWLWYPENSSLLVSCFQCINIFAHAVWIYKCNCVVIGRLFFSFLSFQYMASLFYSQWCFIFMECGCKQKIF